jgi:hypothetical protein
MQTIKTLLIFLCTTTFVFAQGEPVELFRSEGIIPIQISYSNRDLKKSDNDTVFFDTTMKYQTIDGVWNDINVGVRARGNFRRSTCYFPPIKMKIKKKDAKGTIFKGNKKLKLVLPCKLENNNNDNILRELIAYKLYEVISPYHFKTRRVSVDFEEIKKRKTEKFALNGFLIEDDKNVAERLESKNWDRFMHPMNMIPEASVQNNFFQFMIGNTDFSTAYSHNGKLLVNKDNKFIPVPYDFDRGFKRDEAIVNSVRGQFTANKGKFFAIIEGFKADFDNPKSHQEVVEYIESFFTLIEDDKRYKSEIINQMRTK